MLKTSQKHKEMMKKTPPPKLTLYHHQQTPQIFLPALQETAQIQLIETSPTFTQLYIGEKTLLEQTGPNIARGAALSRGHGLLSGHIGFHQRPSFCCHPSAVGSGGGCAKRGLERRQSAAAAL